MLTGRGRRLLLTGRGNSLQCAKVSLSLDSYMDRCLANNPYPIGSCWTEYGNALDAGLLDECPEGKELLQVDWMQQCAGGRAAGGMSQRPATV